MKVQIIDGNNWVRVKLAECLGGSIVRDLYTSVTTNPTIQIWVFDGKGGNKRRRDIYPAYKMQRPETAQSIYASIDLLKKVLQHTPALMCEVDGYEGDDVIAALVTRFRDFYQLEILSTDGDLLALTDHPNVTSIRKPYDGIPAERVRLFKTICGDTSDNISGIPGVGPKTFAKLNHVALTHWLEGKRVLSYGATGAQEDFYMPPKIAEWTAENEELLKAYWAITGFFPVPDITSHVKRGTPDAAAANALMKEYLL